MARTQVHVIRRCSYIPEHNSPHVWFEVHSGDDPRDYVFADFKPLRCTGKFRSEKEAQKFIDEQP